jgi:hypothetical protein
MASVVEQTRESLQVLLDAANAQLDAFDRTAVRLDDAEALAGVFAMRLLVLRERMQIEQALGRA